LDNCMDGWMDGWMDRQKDNYCGENPRSHLNIVSRSSERGFLSRMAYTASDMKRFQHYTAEFIPCSASQLRVHKPPCVVPHIPLIEWSEAGYSIGRTACELKLRYCNGVGILSNLFLGFSNSN
jgi:hypothetical protein